RIKHLLGHAQHAGRARVQHAAAVLGHGADGELGVAGRADLAHGEDLDRRVQRAGHLDAHRHAPARKRHYHRLLLGEGHELRSELAARVAPVKELHTAIILHSKVWARTGARLELRTSGPRGEWRVNWDVSARRDGVYPATP